MALEEVRDLLVDLLDGLLLLLVRVQDLEEGLVRLGLLGEARLDLGHVVDRRLELNLETECLSAETDGGGWGGRISPPASERRGSACASEG